MIVELLPTVVDEAAGVVVSKKPSFAVAAVEVAPDGIDFSK